MLENLRLQDFTVFADADLQFGALNVLHGENSSGKTHVLKLAYSALASLAPGPNESISDKPTKAALEPRLGSKLVSVFRPDKGKLGRLTRRVQGTKSARVSVALRHEGTLAFGFSSRSDHTAQVSAVPAAWLPQAPVFVPTRELLSIYPGFASLYLTQAIPFEETWRDTCLLLGAPITRGPRKKAVADLLAPIEATIGCKAVLEGERFFVEMDRPRAKVEADLVAEGYRKLTMVARLIANGSLDDRSYLFWDEPEANLNPRLVRHLAPLLLDLAAAGVQVFIATHSLFLLRELAIEEARRKCSTTRYFGLHVHEDGVVVTQGSTLEATGDFASLDESLEQSERYLRLMEV